MPVLTAEKLTKSCLKIFCALGVRNAEAEVVTRAMVDANLVGHDSHGVIHLPLKYVPEIEAGLIELGAGIEIKRESPSMAVLDGNWGFGPVIATYAVELAVQKAKTNDLGSVVVSRSNEVGRLGGYALIAAESDMICLLTVNDHGAGGCVVPFGGIEPRLSTNPLACAIPLPGTRAAAARHVHQCCRLGESQGAATSEGGCPGRMDSRFRRNAYDECR